MATLQYILLHFGKVYNSFTVLNEKNTTVHGRFDKFVRLSAASIRIQHWKTKKPATWSPGTA